MTKINKIGKSSFVIAILSFLLVGILAFGGTYAYFTAKSNTVTGAVTTGHLDLGTINATGDAITAESSTLAINNKIVVPNETLVNTVFSANVHSNIAFFSRVKFSVSIDVKADDEGDNGAHDHYAETAGADENTCHDWVDKAIKALIVELNTNATTKLTASLPADEGLSPEQQTAKAATQAAITGFTDSGITWVIGDDTDDSTATQTTAYFYNLGAHAATAIGTDTTVYFPAYIQVEDFLGRYKAEDAQRCPYWMDATISISISFEVMQAEHVQDAVLNAQGGFDTVANAEAAWDTALKTKNA